MRRDIVCAMLLVLACAWVMGAEEETAPDPNAAVEEHLSKLVSFDFGKTPLKDIVKFWRELTGVDFAVDANVDQEQAVTLSVTNMRLGDAIYWATRVRKSHYRLAEGAIIIAPGERHPDAYVMPEDEQATKEIKDKLAEKVTFDFVETPMADVVAYLHELTGVNIIVDPKVDEEVTVTLSVTNIPLENALAWIARLTEAKMTVEHSAIYISSRHGRDL